MYSPINGKPWLNAIDVNVAPDSPDCQAPEATMTKPVMVQITKVSMKVPSIAMVPC